MRALKTLFAFVFLAGTFLVLDQATTPREESRPKPASAEALSIAEVLSSHAGLAVMGIVLGPRSGEERDFRGLNAVDGRMRPIYGRARAVCAGLATRPSCWEIAYLEIDGQPFGDREAAVERRTTTPQSGDDGDIETADISSAVAGRTRLAVLPQRQTPPPVPVGATGSGPASAKADPDRPSARDAAGTRVTSDARAAMGAPASSGRPEASGLPASPGAPATSDALADRADKDKLAARGSDGREVKGPETANSEITSSEYIGPDATDREATGEATGEVPIPAMRPSGAPPAEAGGTSDSAAPRPTHAVARPIINVRNGPGTDRPVVAKLPEGMRLSLIDQRDDWGRFVVLDGAASGREVWAALRILEPLP